MPKHLWSVEEARQMGIKSAALYKERKEQAKQLSAILPLPTDQTADQFPRQRLARVRMQLERVDSMLLTEKDPQRIDRLASAQARLSEQERILDGRPLPGSRKPAPERSKPNRPGSPLAEE